MFKSPRAGGGDDRGFFFRTVGVTVWVDLRARDLIRLPDEDGANDVGAGEPCGVAGLLSEAAEGCSSDEAGTTFFEEALGFLVRAMAAEREDEQ